MLGMTNTELFKVETGEELTRNVKPLLHEIRHALDALLDSGARSVIDLRSMPLARERNSSCWKNSGVAK